MIKYYVLDVETNGLKAGWHEINQISVINAENKKQLSVDIAIEHPERSNQQALDIQGITIADLRKGIKNTEAVKKINEFIRADGLNNASRCIIGHNVAFDRKFCHQLWEDLGDGFPADLWICTRSLGQAYAKKFGGQKLALAQHIVPNAKGVLKPKFGLNILMEGLGMTPKFGAHSATVDTQNTLDLYNFLMNSGMEYVSHIKRIPHKEEKKEVEYIDFE